MQITGLSSARRAWVQWRESVDAGQEWIGTSSAARIPHASHNSRMYSPEAIMIPASWRVVLSKTLAEL